MLMYISEASLESRAHRFKFYDDGNVEYYRQPFNADVQAIPSRPLDLMGVEEIANNPQAADELYRLELELYHRTATHGSE